MSNGKLINKNGWAESFLSWEKNDSTGNDLMWEKLNQKLQAPRKKKRMVLLWAAAALFIITGSAIFWKYQFKGGQESALTFKKHSSALPNAPFIKPVEKAITIINHPTQQETINKKSNNSIIENPVLLVDNSLIVKTVQPVVSDSPQIATANPEIKQRRIRVVHMNEWFSPPPPAFATSKEDNEIPYTPSIWPGKHRGLSPPSSNN